MKQDTFALKLLSTMMEVCTPNKPSPSVVLVSVAGVTCCSRESSQCTSGSGYHPVDVQVSFRPSASSVST